MIGDIGRRAPLAERVERSEVLEPLHIVLAQERLTPFTIILIDQAVHVIVEHIGTQLRAQTGYARKSGPSPEVQDASPESERAEADEDSEDEEPSSPKLADTEKLDGGEVGSRGEPTAVNLPERNRVAQALEPMMNPGKMDFGDELDAMLAHLRAHQANEGLRVELVELEETDSPQGGTAAWAPVATHELEFDGPDALTACLRPDQAPAGASCEVTAEAAALLQKRREHGTTLIAFEDDCARLSPPFRKERALEFRGACAEQRGTDVVITKLMLSYPRPR